MKIETRQGAFKEHKCAICGKTIKIGDLYALRVIQTGDNEIEKLPCHIHCYNKNTFSYWWSVYKRCYTHYCKKCCDYDELILASDKGLIKADDSRIFFCKQRIREIEYILGIEIGKFPDEDKQKGKLNYDYAELKDSEIELLLDK